MKTDEFLERLEGVRQNGSGYIARCPFHDDRTASLGITEADDKILLRCHAGCSTEDILSTLGLQWRDLWFDGQATEREPLPKDPEAVYRYVDEAHRELYRVLRYPGKRFKHERRTVPYQLPHVILAVKEGRTIYVCEGEKDVHALEHAGRIATCNAGGAGSWKPEWGDVYFTGAKVIVVADRDEPGIRHAKDVAAMLYSAAEKLWIVQPAVGKDAFDHLAAGLPVEDMEVIEVVKG